MPRSLQPMQPPHPPRHESLRVEFCKHIPENLEQGVIYISMEYHTSIHLCACGWCNQQTVLPFHPLHLSTGWIMESKVVDGETLVTFIPSVGNWQFPCKSHYYIRENKIVWL